MGLPFTTRHLYKILDWDRAPTAPAETAELGEELIEEPYPPLSFAEYKVLKGLIRLDLQGPIRLVRAL